MFIITPYAEVWIDLLEGQLLIAENKEQKKYKSHVQYLLLSHLISDDVSIVHLLFHQENSLTGAFNVNYRRQSHELKEKPSLFQLMHVVLCKFFPIVAKRIKGL